MSRVNSPNFTYQSGTSAEEMKLGHRDLNQQLITYSLLSWSTGRLVAMDSAFGSVTSLDAHTHEVSKVGQECEDPRINHRGWTPCPS